MNNEWGKENVSGNLASFQFNILELIIGISERERERERGRQAEAIPDVEKFSPVRKLIWNGPNYLETKTIAKNNNNRSALTKYPIIRGNIY